MTASEHNLPGASALEQAAQALQTAFETGDHEARDQVEEHVPWLATVPLKLFSLANAQLVIARKHGFDSWGQALKHAAALEAPFADRVSRFIQAACSHEFKLAERMLAADPQLAVANVFTASITGNVETAHKLLAEDNALSQVKGGPGDRTALSYLCFSRFLLREESRQAMIEIAELLLDAGSDANAYYMINADPNARQTCLYGAAGVNNVAPLTDLLLNCGADPNDRAPGLGPESLYHASEFQDLECLRLLLAARPHADKVSYCLGRKLDYEDPDGVTLYLLHNADPNFRTPWGEEQNRLHGAIARRCSADVIKLLLDAGADVAARVRSGRTPYAWAVRWGHAGAAKLLLNSGASETEASPVDRFLGACFQADESTARSLLISYPDLVKDLTPPEQGTLAQAAHDGNLPAVKLMVELGFPQEAQGDFGTAVNQAAWRGNADVVEYLISCRANLEAVNRYRGTAVDCCVFGSANCEDNTRGIIAGKKQLRRANYLRCVQSLIAAGANLAKVSPFPSGNREIDDLLRRHGRVD